MDFTHIKTHTVTQMLWIWSHCKHVITYTNTHMCRRSHTSSDHRIHLLMGKHDKHMSANVHGAHRTHEHMQTPVFALFMKSYSLNFYSADFFSHVNISGFMCIRFYWSCVLFSRGTEVSCFFLVLKYNYYSQTSSFEFLGPLKVKFRN